jgi:hypothetical protein
VLVFVRFCAEASPESVLSTMAITATNRINLIMKYLVQRIRLTPMEIWF